VHAGIKVDLFSILFWVFLCVKIVSVSITVESSQLKIKTRYIADGVVKGTVNYYFVILARKVFVPDALVEILEQLNCYTFEVWMNVGIVSFVHHNHFMICARRMGGVMVILRNSNL
jgi:hypothetical protein